MKVKVGDIFYDNNGVARFFQVVKVYESGRIRIRQIDKEEHKTECGYEMIAKPIPNSFLPKREYEEFEKRYVDILDNEKGAIKEIREWKGKPIIEFKYSICEQWNNEKVISSYYNIWMK